MQTHGTFKKNMCLIKKRVLDIRSKDNYDGGEELSLPKELIFVPFVYFLGVGQSVNQSTFLVAFIFLYYIFKPPIKRPFLRIIPGISFKFSQRTFFCV